VISCDTPFHELHYLQEAWRALDNLLCVKPAAHASSTMLSCMRV
jgi:hypothetical protein